MLSHAHPLGITCIATGKGLLQPVQNLRLKCRNNTVLDVILN